MLNTDAILKALPGTSIAVAGDVCLDLYHDLSHESEVSLETGLPTRIVAGTRCYLGGAGNVAANLASLGVGEVTLFGVVGDDLYAREIVRLCEAAGIRTDGLLTRRGWNTNVYTKLYRDDDEEPRIDMGTLNELEPAIEGDLVDMLRDRLPQADAVIINQQIRNGMHGPAVRAALCRLIADHPAIPFFLDSRDYPDEYPGAIRKLNEREALGVLEAARTGGAPGREGDGAPRNDTELSNEAEAACARLHARWKRPVYLTLGELGCLVADDSGTAVVEALAVSGPVDTVGAGDSMLAGIVCASCAGAAPQESARFGTYVASVTVGKLRQAGVATPQEVQAVAREPDLLHRPQLARAPWRARYHGSTAVEIVSGLPGSSVRYALFDHDGTISTVREGWEAVMVPMMIEAILGMPAENAPDERVRGVDEAVRALIQRTTGIRTIVQMEALRSLAVDFGYVSRESVLSPREYKRIYNDRLMEVVRARIARLQAGELETSDLTIKGAVAFLHALRAGGISLFLASGTDEADTRNEATLLGYAELFDGGIFGSLDDSPIDPKRLVIGRILQTIGPRNGGKIVVFGDGPVEIRETGRAGGYRVGVAASEVRRYGLDATKRERLVLAGADCIISDYANPDELLRMLGVQRAAEEENHA